jgi:3-oxoacyl-[acyl-carrier-protein] synthase-3
MPRTAFVALGTHVPDRVVTNDDLTKVMETSDAWIQERTGIRERRWVPEGVEVDNSELALQATNRALAKAGWQAKDIEQ